MEVDNKHVGAFVSEPVGLTSRLQNKSVWLEPLALAQVEVIGFRAWIHPCLLREIEAAELEPQ